VDNIGGEARGRITSLENGYIRAHLVIYRCGLQNE
jgi:hypothetical protein